MAGWLEALYKENEKEQKTEANYEDGNEKKDKQRKKKDEAKENDEDGHEQKDNEQLKEKED